MSLNHSMTTRRARDEEEERMTQLLSDRGLLEPGMSYTDKKDLMSVLKESENMAVVKSNEPCPEDMQVEPDCEGDGNINQSDETVMENVKEEFVAFIGRKQTPRKLYSGRSSMDNTSVATVGKGDVPSNKTPSPRSAQNDIETEKEADVAKGQETERDETDIPKATAGGASAENMELDVESTSNVDTVKSDNSDVDMLPESPEPSVSSKQESVRKVRPVTSKKSTSFIKSYMSPVGKHATKDDGNINVFDVACSTREPAVALQRRCVQAQERFPFFFLQQDIHLDAFTKHFRKYVDRYRKNLLHIQRSSVNFLEWGKPIPVTFLKGGATMSDVKKPDLARQISSNTYNFRERVVKHKDPYSISDSEDFVDDSAVGMGSKDTYVPDSSGSESDGIILRREKRKGEHKDDHEWKNSVDGGRSSASKKLKFSVSKVDVRNLESVDSDEDFAPSGSKRTQKRGGRRGGIRGRAGKMVEGASKPVHRRQLSSRARSKAVKTLSVVMEGVEETASSELHSQKNEEPDARQQQTTSSKPGSQENVRVCSSPESKPNSQEQSCTSLAENAKENSDGSDITFLGLTSSKVVQDQRSSDVMCPICGNSFTPEQIEMHASTCDLYPSDRSQNDDPNI